MKIKGNRIWVGGCFIPGILEIDGEKIVRILPAQAEDAPDVDYGDKRIVPGFIDIHTHGAYGFDTNSADPQGLREWMRRLPEEGVTSFLATTLTAQEGILCKSLLNVVRVRQQKPPGAHLLGAHLEGPYIDAAYHGAQPLEAVSVPNVSQFTKYQRAAGGLIRLITLAPEHDADMALTRYCAQHGVAVSVGHSAATFEQVALAVANGARSVTHTFNAMRGFGHRENGVAGAAMRFDEVYTEVIGDCCHTTPEALNLLFRSKGKHRPILVSDSLLCKGFAPGYTCRFADMDITIYPDGSAHTEDGTFAGSTLKINEGLRNLVERALVPFDAALNACTANPAALLGLDHHIGSLTAGHDADIVVLDDDYTVLKTYCRGVAQSA